MIVGYSKMLLLGPPMGLQIGGHITKNSNCKNRPCVNSPIYSSYRCCCYFTPKNQYNYYSLWVMNWRQMDYSFKFTSDALSIRELALFNFSISNCFAVLNLMTQRTPWSKPKLRIKNFTSQKGKPLHYKQTKTDAKVCYRG